MKFKIRHADKIVGFFSLAALIGLVVLIFAIGAKQNWFAKKNNYYTFFETGSGISVGMDLTYKGFSVGKVQKINLQGIMVRVDYYVLHEYEEYMKEGTLVELIVSPVGLGSSFVLHPGRGKELLEDGSEIYRVDSYKGKKIVEDKLNRVKTEADSIGVLLAKVSGLVDNLNVLLSSVGNAFEGRHKSAPLTQLVANLNQVLANVASLTEGLSNTEGAIPKLLGEQLNGEIVSILQNLDVVAGNLNTISSDAEPKINSALSELNTTIIQLNDVLTGLKGNVLIRGGVPDRSHQESATVPLRNIDF